MRRSKLKTSPSPISCEHVNNLICSISCFSTSVNQSKVVAGSNTLDSGGDRYNISEIFIHPNFTMEWLQNDIALLRLSSQIQFSKNVSALNLPSTNVGVGEKVVAAGWGVYRIPRDVPNNLQHINLTTISVSKCQKTMPVTDTQVCTFTKKGEGICYGDSGGPLVSAGHILQGIVSFGIPCAAGYPDVYSRVYSFLSWIDETIKTDNVTITTI